MCDQQRLRSACAYAQSDQSLCLTLEYSMTVKLLTEHHLEFLSLKGGCTDSSESTLSLVKMPYCWKSCVKREFLPISNLIQDQQIPSYCLSHSKPANYFPLPTSFKTSKFLPIANLVQDQHISIHCQLCSWPANVLKFRTLLAC